MTGGASTTTVLVLGATGMLGHATLRLLAGSPGVRAWGTVRSERSRDLLPAALRAQALPGVDVLRDDDLARAFDAARPDVVINAVGLVKQLAEADDPLQAIPVNALLPHRLAALCAARGARLVHISTDCVFTGSRGLYREDEPADAQDLYGRSKHLGEVTGRPHAITLRTSIIGHELAGKHGLVEWFLAQPGPVRGFTRAVFSGVPTVELARIIRDHVLPNPALHGLYHVSAAPIDKHALLGLVCEAYGRSTVIEPDDRLVIDRSLDSSRFRAATGWVPAPWPELVRAMREFG